jgi:peptidoglycan/LPS O-acetylase OafA/YrhL
MKIDRLDELKGVAIMMVILVHTSQKFILPSILSKAMSLGQFGCQLFFVISGFSLAMSFEQNHVLRNYFFNRLISVAPGYYIAIFLFTLSSLIERLVGFEPLSEITIGGIITNVLFAHGLFPEYCNSVVRGGGLLEQ